MPTESTRSTTIRLLFFFLAVTSAGSNLSAIASFLRIESVFGSNATLAYSLSAKTMIMLAASYAAPVILGRWPIKAALVLSQMAGLVSVVCIFLAFAGQSEHLLMIGIAASGFPLALMNVAIVAELKHLVADKTEFVSISGSRTLMLGAIFMLSAVAAPFLLDLFSLSSILIFDGVTFLLGIVILMILPLPGRAETDRKPALNALFTFMVKPHAKTFLLPVVGLMLLSGVIPLGASSISFSITASLPDKMREGIWTLEAAALMLTGVVYRYTVRAPWLRWPILLGSAALLVGLFSGSHLVLFVAVGVLALTLNLGFQIFRDELVMASSSIAESQMAASFGEFTRTLFLAMSPLVLTALNDRVGLHIIWFMLAFQICMAALYLMISRKA